MQSHSTPDRNLAPIASRADRDPSLPYTEAELRGLAEDLSKYAPSLAQLLVALGSKDNPLANLN